MRVPPFCLAVVACLLAGCLAAVDVPAIPRPMTLVLSFALVNESSERRLAYPGEHCASASVWNGEARLENESYRRIHSRPFLIVLPATRGDWSTLGTEGYALGVPAGVKTGIPDASRLVGRIAWVGNATAGHVSVDGVSVPLPFSWSVRDAHQHWRAESTLSVGPTVVRTFDRAGPCM